MANYSSLKNALANVIKPNDNQEITGQIMQDALMAMINALGAGYQFAGVPTAQTDPSTPDQNVFYIAGAGTYPNFGATKVPRGSLGVFRYNGSWDYSVLDVASWADASNKLYYNTQAGNVAAKTIQADGFTLQPGGWIKIHFDNANTVDNPTLNVNNTGAHTMTFNGRPVSATNSWKAGETVAFYYDNYGVGIWRGIRLVEYPDFINVNELVGQNTPFASASEARSAIPQQNRKAGLNIAYLLSTGEETSQWQLDMFIGDDVTDWGVADNWKTIGPVSVSQNVQTTIKKGVSIEIGGEKYNIQDKDLNERVAEVSIMTHYAGWFNSGGEIGSLDTARFVVIPIDGSVSTWTIKTNTNKTLVLYYLASFDGQPESGDVLNLVSGTDRVVLDENREYSLSVPGGTYYIAFCVVNVQGDDASPQKVIISGVDYAKPIRTIISGILSDFNTLQTDVNSISANLSSTNTMLGKVSGVTPEYSVIPNHYVQSNGNVVSYNNYNMTAPILMFPNDKIAIKTRFYNTGIAAIAKTNIDGTQFTQLVESNSDSEAVEYTYIATEKCYVALSYVAAQMVYIKMDMLEALHSVAQESGEAVDSIDFLPLLSDNPLERIRFDAGMAAVFRKWGFVGDSLSSGAFEYNEGGVWGAYDDYDMSWGQYMCRLTGAEGFNFSVGGEYAKRWILGSDDGKNLRRWGDGNGGVMEGGAHDNLKDAYIIALGVNDRANLATYYPDGIGTFSTDVDTSDYNNNNEDSFIGCYAGIIQRLKSVQPKAKFFLVSMPVDAGEPYNTQIQNCVAAFDNCFYIDLFTYAPDYGEGHGDRTTFVNRYFTGNHMNALGYMFTAYEMMTYIDWIIRKNFDKFSDIQFIGTNHSWTD